MTDASGGMVTFTLPGASLDAVYDGNWRNDNPRGFDRIVRAPSRKVGKGYQLVVTMDRADADDLADYIWSVATLWATLTTEERGTDRPAPMFTAVERIRSALSVGRGGDDGG